MEVQEVEEVELGGGDGPARGGLHFVVTATEHTSYFERRPELSGKVVVCLALLEKAREKGDKVLLFSSSLVFLDLLEFFLKGGEESGSGGGGGGSTSSCSSSNSSSSSSSSCSLPKLHRRCWARLDGTMSQSKKEEAMRRFQRDKQCGVFLLSVTAANVGINLTAATRVIIADQSWNPATDLQAIFRSYRYGQTKPVFVYRLVAAGAMEEKIFNRQLNKRALASGVGDDDQLNRNFNTTEYSDLLNVDDLKVVVGNSTASAAANAPLGAHGQDHQELPASSAVGTLKSVESTDNNDGGDNADGMVSSSRAKSGSAEQGGGDGAKKEKGGDDDEDENTDVLGELQPVAGNADGAVVPMVVIGGVGGGAGAGWQGAGDVLLKGLLSSPLVKKWVHKLTRFDSLLEPDEVELSEEELLQAEAELEAELRPPVVVAPPAVAPPAVGVVPNPSLPLATTDPLLGAMGTAAAAAATASYVSSLNNSSFTPQAAPTFAGFATAAAASAGSALTQMLPAGAISAISGAFGGPQLTPLQAGILGAPPPDQMSTYGHAGGLNVP